MKKTIAVDMDNVIADVCSHYITWYKKEYGVEIDPADMLGKPETGAFPEKGAVMKFLHTPGFFRSAPVVPGAQEALMELAETYEIYIVSAAMEFPQSLREKYDWLAEHFPFIPWRNIVFCGNKGIIGTDYMIDDHMYNLDAFTGKGILFTASHNIHAGGYTRVNNWEEALRFLKAEAMRIEEQGA